MAPIQWKTPSGRIVTSANADMTASGWEKVGGDEPTIITPEVPETDGEDVQEDVFDPGQHTVPETDGEDVQEDVFDPGQHTVPETLEYLTGKGDAEVQRVLEAERSGKNRSSLLDALKSE